MPVQGWVPKGTRKAAMKPNCEECGTVSQLGLHHRDENRRNNSPDNLRTLCAACHTRLHWETGKTPWRRHPDTCTVCGKPAKRLGLCETHRSRWLRHGNPYLTKKQIGCTWQLVDERTGLPVNGSEFQELQREFQKESTG